MRKIVCTILLILCCGLTQMTYGQSAYGRGCDNPRPIRNAYTDVLTEAGEYWYTSQTYDLPITVRFMPSSTLVPDPQVYVDFRCEDEEYAEDLQNVIDLMDGSYKLNEPIALKKNLDGSFERTIDAGYRDKLATLGVTRNVKAYVRVVLNCGGNVEVNPTTITRDCMSSCPKVTMPDTLTATATHAATSDNTLVMPFAEWQDMDSIRFVWTGVEDSVDIWLGANDCHFYPHQDSANAIHHFTLQPGEQLKMTGGKGGEIKALMNQLVHGGVYYAKVLSSEAGQVIVEPVPLQEASAGSQLLVNEKSYAISQQDTVLYYFGSNRKATRFEAATTQPFIMYIGTTANFDTTACLRRYSFDKTTSGRILELSDKEMNMLTSQATDDNLYVRFSCPVATSLVAHKWNVDDCLQSSIQVRSGEAITFQAGNTAQPVYRMRFADWQFGASVSRSGQGGLSFWCGDNCNLNVGNNIKTFANNETTWEWETINTLTPSQDGFLMVRLVPQRNGSITFVAYEPVIIEPILVDSVVISPRQVTFNNSLKSQTFTYKVYPENADDQVVAWSAEEAGIITWKAGMKSAVMVNNTAGGVAKVIVYMASNPQIADTAIITVANVRKVSEIEISGDTLLNDTLAHTYTAEVLPLDAANRAITWQIESGAPLVQWDGEHPVLRALPNMPGGEVLLKAMATDGSGVAGRYKIRVAPITVIPTVSQITLSSTAGTTLSAQSRVTRILAAVEPQLAANTPLNWSISGDTQMVDWDAATQTIMLRMHQPAGKLRVTATATDEGAQTGSINLDWTDTYVLVNEIIIFTLEGVNTLDAAHPELHLQAEVVPDSAEITTVTWSVVSGGNLCNVADNVVSLKMGAAAGDLVMKASAMDNSGVTALYTIHVASTDEPLRSMQVFTREEVYVLNNQLDSLHYYVVFDPPYTTQQSIMFSIMEGKQCIEPLNMFPTEQGFLVRRRKDAPTGHVVIRAISLDADGIYADLHLDVEAATEGLNDLIGTSATRRLIMRNGEVLVEITTHNQTLLYTLQGQRVND